MVVAATAGPMVAQADDVAPRPGWRMTAGPPEPVHPREWTPIVDEMEIRRGGLDATVQIGASHVAILRKQLGRQCEVLGLTGDARVQVRVSAPTPLMIA